MFVATNGIVEAGVEMFESVTKMRNPFMHPGSIVRQFMANLRLTRSVHDSKVPDYFFLWEQVHPSLVEQAHTLERLAVRFILCIKALLVNEGRDLVTDQINLARLSDMCMHIYALNACVARASRAYAIGLPNAQHELALAFLVAREADHQVNILNRSVEENRSAGGIDSILVNVGEKVLKAKAHSATHCLSRSY